MIKMACYVEIRRGRFCRGKACLAIVSLIRRPESIWAPPIIKTLSCGVILAASCPAYPELVEGHFSRGQNPVRGPVRPILTYW